MTTKDSILALAAKISNDTVPNVATDAQALGELAKAMCGSAPTEPIATVDDAITYITANYSGGGGGVDVGPLVQVMYLANTDTEPAVGNAIDLTTVYDVAIIKVGDATIADNTTSGNGTPSDAGWASGVTLTTYWMPAFDDPTRDAAYAFLYTVETVEEVDYYKTVSILEDAVTMETETDGGDVRKRYTYTVPEVEEGTFFAVAYVGYWE